MRRKQRVSRTPSSEQVRLGFRDETIQARFLEFHRQNPDVYEELRWLALDYRDRGYPCIGIGHLVEIIRWRRRMETYDPTSQFKVNNNYRSRYARLLMELEPRLAGFITIRELQTP